MKVKLMVLASAALLASGCASTNSGHIGPAGIYSNVQGPGLATDAVNSSLEGTSCASNILGMIATGDNSIETAKKNGGITKVSSVDYEASVILGLYAKVCTKVRGSAGGGASSVAPADGAEGEKPRRKTKAKE